MALLTACLVVKDEAARLEATLTALADFVDEIVVHDTGSSDDTVRIAERSGCVVVEGTWGDSFSAARNVALDQARGEWVLSVDADEVCSGAAGRLRSWLSEVEGPLAVTLRNSGGGQDGALLDGYEFTAVRLFRRLGARWVGRVHERVVAATGLGGATPMLVPRDLLTIDHTGYSDPDALQRKARRNGRLAQMELDELMAAGAPPQEIASTALKVGRSAVGSGELQRAVDAFEAVRALGGSGNSWVEATDYLARVLLGAGEAELGMVLADQLHGAGVSSAYCSWLRAQGLAQAGRPADALAEIDGVEDIVDTASRRHDPAGLDALRSLCRELIDVR